MLRLSVLILCGALAVSGQFRSAYTPPKYGAATPPVLYNSLNLTFVVSAKDIPNKNLIADLDPYIKVYYTNRTHAEPVKIDTTEVVDNTASPEFIKVISFVWEKGLGQKINFKVKDHNKLSDETIGEATLDLDDYVLNKNQKANISLTPGGSLLVQKTTPIKIRLSARNLMRKDVFDGKSDPFAIAYWRRGPYGKEVPFYTTKTINNVENVDWDETIVFTNYIKGEDQWFVFKVKDDDGIGSKADDLGQALLEIDPFVGAHQPKVIRLGTFGKSGPSELTVTQV